MIGEPLSLYIHIPFCVHKCRYCDFYSVAYEERLADAYLYSLGQELALICREHNLNNSRVDTIYIGGGTPSLLSIAQWDILSESIQQHIRLSEHYEWTVECNPESFSDEKAHAYFQSGVTRITIGIQSLNQRELSIMGRVHSQQRIYEVLNNPILDQFVSVGVDCIFGLPGQTMDSLNQTLDTLLDRTVVKHISVYELAIGDTTPFGKHHAILPLPDENTVYEMTQHIIDRCLNSGFEHYEISNFARPGYRCRHNEAYWDHKSYIGLGTSAHSYVPPYRYANHNDIVTYIRVLQEGSIPERDSELIDSETIAREVIFLGVRRSDGIEENDFNLKTGIIFKGYVGSETLKRMVSDGSLIYEGSRWKPTRKGMLIADTIARDLMRYEKTD